MPYIRLVENDLYDPLRPHPSNKCRVLSRIETPAESTQSLVEVHAEQAG